MTDTVIPFRILVIPEILKRRVATKTPCNNTRQEEPSNDAAAATTTTTNDEKRHRCYSLVQNPYLHSIVDDTRFYTILSLKPSYDTPPNMISVWPLDSADRACMTASPPRDNTHVCSNEDEEEVEVGENEVTETHHHSPPLATTAVQPQQTPMKKIREICRYAPSNCRHGKQCQFPHTVAQLLAPMYEENRVAIIERTQSVTLCRERAVYLHQQIGLMKCGNARCLKRGNDAMHNKTIALYKQRGGRGLGYCIVTQCRTCQAPMSPGQNPAHYALPVYALTDAAAGE